MSENDGDEAPGASGCAGQAKRRRMQLFAGPVEPDQIFPCWHKEVTAVTFADLSDEERMPVNKKLQTGAMVAYIRFTGQASLED